MSYPQRLIPGSLTASIQSDGPLYQHAIRVLHEKARTPESQEESLSKLIDLHAKNNCLPRYMYLGISY